MERNVGVADAVKGLRGRAKDVWDNPTPFSVVDIVKQLYTGLRGAGRAVTGGYTVQPEVPGQWSEADEFRAQHAAKTMKEDAGALAGGLMTGTMPMLAGRTPSILGMFAGPLARTADRAALSRAKMLESSGAGPEDVLKETKWFRGPDEQWRFEFSDRGATIGPSTGIGEPKWLSTTGSLAGLFQHPLLFKNYPVLASIPTKIYRDDKMWGQYDTIPRERIQAGGPHIDDMVSALLHESQHAIQKREGWHPGGVPPKAILPGSPGWDVYEQLLSRRGYAPTGSKRPPPATEQELRDQAAFNWYQRLAGEVEARNVEARQFYSDPQRLAQPPWVSEDIPRSLQIMQHVP